MTARPQPASQTIEEADGDLDPALLRIIRAMARADARRDYAAAMAQRQAESTGALRPPAA